MSREPLYRLGQRLLKEYIKAHGLSSGDALPPESELAEEFGMSRLSLREAVKGLETVGVLHTRHGGRIYVSEFSFAPILDNLPYSLQLSGRGLRDLLELRESLEEGLMAKTRRAVRPADIRELRILASAMGDASDDVELAQADRRFHRRLYEPLDNRLVVEMIDLFWTAFHRLVSEQSERRPASQQLVKIHLAIVEALEHGDDTQAIDAMTHHFDDIREWLEERAAHASLSERAVRVPS